MNPNLAIFLKHSLYAVVIAGLLFGAYYALSNFTAISLEKVSSHLMYAFVGIVIAGMMILIIGVTVRQVWPGILRRSETITLCCPDRSGGGVHVVGKHHFSGGEMSDGYDAWQHYYIRISDGKIFMSRKIKTEGSLSESLEELSEKLNIRLQPDKSREVKVGYYEENDRPVERSMNMANVTLTIKGFDVWVDYGFRITCFTGNKRKWQRAL
jgi:hypothetical protein